MDRFRTPGENVADQENQGENRADRREAEKGRQEK